MAKYIPVIGMEVHVELKTNSKMFCSCKNALPAEASAKAGLDNREPNINICPVCTGQPGTLPVANAKAIEFVQMMGLALNCELNLQSKFDRKNYFYPDLPKGYQISQYDEPLCGKGYMQISLTPNPSPASGRGGQEKAIKKIGITRIHLEEDTGKLIHPKGVDYTLVDFNRAGVPLMELVTEPDFETGEEARLFCQKLQQICRYLGISDADMEKGQMRCEANVSLYKEGEEKLSGTKVEVKNINSFKFVEKAINYEIERQKEVLEKGEKVVQETRGFDGNKNATVSQRAKESAHDYRYFPEPDIPPLEFAEDYVENLRRKLPELPEKKMERFAKEYDLPVHDVEIITGDIDLSNYFEDVASEIQAIISDGECKADLKKAFKLGANYLIVEVRKMLAEENKTVANLKITAENFAEFIGILADDKINSSAGQTVLWEMFHNGSDPSQIIEAKNLAQTNDEGELQKIVEEVLAKNEKSVTDYKAGKLNALQFLMGQVMSATRGKANPGIVTKLLKQELEK